MESDPHDVRIENDTTGHQELCKSSLIDPACYVGLEVNAAVHQQFDRLRRIHVLVEVKLSEIELPHASFITVDR